MQERACPILEINQDFVKLLRSVLLHSSLSDIRCLSRPEMSRWVPENFISEKLNLVESLITDGFGG